MGTSLSQLPQSISFSSAHIPLDKNKSIKLMLSPKVQSFFDSCCYGSECKHIEQDKDGKQQDNMWKS
jgi:hypothetical protein